MTKSSPTLVLNIFDTTYCHVSENIQLEQMNRSKLLPVFIEEPAEPGDKVEDDGVIADEIDCDVRELGGDLHLQQRGDVEQVNTEIHPDEDKE